MSERLISSVRSLRLASRLSQEALAAQVGISPQALRAIEAGKAVPATDVALRLARALGHGVEEIFRLPETSQAVAVESPTPLERDSRVQLASVDGRLVARPLRGQRGVLRALPRADGVATGPSSVRLMVPGEALERRLLIAGCDPAMALLSQALPRSRANVELLVEESSSRAALTALARREVHLAGCHLLDESTGTFNRGFVERAVPFPCTLVTFATWEQGLIVQPRNPLGIRGAADLARPGVRLVNREPGAGSRQLLDAHLRRAGVPAEAVSGYETEVNGHLAVAEWVAAGHADAGVGVKAAAVALGMDFVPLASERYDLVIPNHYLEHAGVQAMLDLLKQRGFRSEVEALGGYDISSMGGPAA